MQDALEQKNHVSCQMMRPLYHTAPMQQGTKKHAMDTPLVEVYIGVVKSCLISNDASMISCSPDGPRYKKSTAMSSSHFSLFLVH